MRFSKVIIFSLLVLFVYSCSKDYEAPNTFSDVSWYTSKRTEKEFNVLVGDFMGFVDLSQGELSHEWTIEDGDFYLKGSFDVSDSVELFIDHNAPLSTTDKKILVYFNEPGIRKVRLYNTFEDSVGFNDEVPFPAVKEGDIWVIDTTFQVDVFDTMKPAYKVYQLLEDDYGNVIEEKEILSIAEDDLPNVEESDSWPTVNVEVGGRLKFVDLTTTDRPTGRTWRVNNKPNSMSTSSQEEAIFFFSVYGHQSEMLGSFTSTRTGEDIPASTETKIIPLKVNVISSSKPFRYAGGASRITKDKIAISLSGEAGEMIDAEKAFTVYVQNENVGFDADIAVLSVNTKADDKTIIELSLASPIYEDDVVMVAFDSSLGTIKSLDERALQNMEATSVAIEVESDNIFANADFFGFEAYQAAIPAECPGYWHQNVGPWLRSTEKAFSGEASMRYKYNIDNANDAGNVLWGWKQKELVSVSAGDYLMTVHFYIEPGSDIKTVRCGLEKESLAWASLFQVTWDLSNLERGQWHTLTQAVTFTDSALSGETSRFAWSVYAADNPGVSGVQTFYFDDYKLQEYDPRPAL